VLEDWTSAVPDDTIARACRRLETTDPALAARLRPVLSELAAL
jgi:hypothetical protein